MKHKDKRKKRIYSQNEFYCPETLIIHYNLKTESDLMSTFGITFPYAKVLIDKINKRSKILTANEKSLVKIFEKKQNN